MGRSSADRQFDYQHSRYRGRGVVGVDKNIFMKIEVKQEHIEKGKRQDACHCPVALAIKDTVKVKFVYVHLFEINLKKKWARKAVEITLSKKVEKFVKKFDDGKKVKPFSFELKI